MLKCIRTKTCDMWKMQQHFINVLITRGENVSTTDSSTGQTIIGLEVNSAEDIDRKTTHTHTLANSSK